MPQSGAIRDALRTGTSKRLPTRESLLSVPSDEDCLQFRDRRRFVQLTGELIPKFERPLRCRPRRTMARLAKRSATRHLRSNGPLRFVRPEGVSPPATEPRIEGRPTLRARPGIARPPRSTCPASGTCPPRAKAPFETSPQAWRMRARWLPAIIAFPYSFPLQLAAGSNGSIFPSSTARPGSITSDEPYLA